MRYFERRRRYIELRAELDIERERHQVLLAAAERERILANERLANVRRTCSEFADDFAKAWMREDADRAVVSALQDYYRRPI